MRVTKFSPEQQLPLCWIGVLEKKKPPDCWVALCFSSGHTTGHSCKLRGGPTHLETVTRFFPKGSPWDWRGPVPGTQNEECCAEQEGPLALNGPLAMWRDDV